MLRFGAVFDRNGAEMIENGAETIEIGAETIENGRRDCQEIYDFELSFLDWKAAELRGLWELRKKKKKTSMDVNVPHPEMLGKRTSVSSAVSETDGSFEGLVKVQGNLNRAINQRVCKPTLISAAETVFLAAETVVSAAETVFLAAETIVSAAEAAVSAAETLVYRPVDL